MEEEAAKSAIYYLKFEVLQVFPQVFIHNNWCDSNVLNNVGEDGGNDTIVFQWLFEVVNLFLETADLLDPPLNEGEPVLGGEPDNGVQLLNVLLDLQ